MEKATLRKSSSELNAEHEQLVQRTERGGQQATAMQTAGEAIFEMNSSNSALFSDNQAARVRGPLCCRCAGMLDGAATGGGGGGGKKTSGPVSSKLTIKNGKRKGRAKIPAGGAIAATEQAGFDELAACLERATSRKSDTASEGANGATSTGGGEKVSGTAKVAIAKGKRNADNKSQRSVVDALQTRILPLLTIWSATTREASGIQPPSDAQPTETKPESEPAGNNERTLQIKRFQKAEQAAGEQDTTGPAPERQRKIVKKTERQLSPTRQRPSPADRPAAEDSEVERLRKYAGEIVDLAQQTLSVSRADLSVDTSGRTTAKKVSSPVLGKMKIGKKKAVK